MNVFLGHVALDHWTYATDLAIPAVLAAVGTWAWARHRATADHGAPADHRQATP